MLKITSFYGNEWVSAQMASHGWLKICLKYPLTSKGKDMKLYQNFVFYVFYILCQFNTLHQVFVFDNDLLSQQCVMYTGTSAY